MLELERYSSLCKDEWDTFVSISKNGSFLFYRDYQEYHSDRFQDHSLVFRSKEKTIALLPACREGDSLVSHGGLTFGGILSDEKMTTPVMLEVFELLLSHAKQEMFSQIIYKACPSIYHAYPADEDLYALQINNARLFRRDVSSVLSPSDHPKMQERRKRSIKKALKFGVTCRETGDVKEFWSILSEVLKLNHNATPAHSLDEITLLKSKFPNEIRLFCAYQDDRMIAGTLIFENQQIAHTQYIASSDLGKSLGGLDLIFGELISKVYTSKKWFSFGISTENQGMALNEGLIGQKEGFGARACVHDFYQIDLAV
ncbi:hypothetical protein OAF84_02175 [Akkermansiaceae bacterium]|nr:hypothetical protein [Akkermansiaceae bacterium]